MKKDIKKKLAYVSPLISTVNVEMEQGIAAGSANINSGSSSNSQVPQEREFENGWSNNRDFDL